MIAYLDSKSFDHLYSKHGCTSADIGNLRKRIYGRELSIPLSMHHLEEIMLDRHARPELRVAKIKLTLSIGNFRRMLKPCEQLLTDALRARMRGDENPRPLIDASLQNVISEGLSDLVESDGEELNEDLIGVLEEARAQRERFAAGFREALAEIAEHTVGASSRTEYYTQCAPLLTQKLASAAGLVISNPSQCDELMEVKSIQAYVAIATSLEYAVTSTHYSRPTDYSVVMHAIGAAEAAQVFVSSDAALREVLDNPHAPIAVLDLPGFLHQAG
jgi:hypothetical protein